MFELMVLFFAMGGTHSVEILSPPASFSTPVYEEVEAGRYVVLVNVEGSTALFRINLEAFFALGAKGLPTEWASVAQAIPPLDEAVRWAKDLYDEHGQELRLVSDGPLAEALAREPEAVRSARRAFSVSNLIQMVERAQ